MSEINNKIDEDCKEIDQEKIRCKSLIIEDTKYRTLYNKKFENRKTWEKENTKEIKAFIPGVIKEINVKPGQKVKKGDKLLILEAMKMYNELKVTVSGKIKDIKVITGQCVMKNQVLIEIE